MINYKAVPSGLELSRRIADCLEASAPRGYTPDDRSRAIRGLNDILQGRSTRPVDELLAELDTCGDTRLPAILEDVRAFLRQKELLTVPYDKRPSRKRFTFEWMNGVDERRLKIINQKLYDRAAREGFPTDFFRESYFDHVTFYCLLKFADFLGSELHNCKFAVCSVRSASFILSHVYDTEFYSSILNYVDLCGAVLANTHFQDCELSNVLAQKFLMKRCNTIDCTMDGVDYAGTILDGCTFGRITAGTIRLDWATITQTGATAEECYQNRKDVYRALGVKEAAA